MDYLELLSHRRSHRAFTPERVSPQDVQKLLLAANGAPVGSNLYKDLHLTVVQDPEILRTLSRAAIERRRDRATMEKIVSSIDGQSADRVPPDPFYGASTVIFVSHRKQDLQPGIEYANVACAVLSMQLEAAELGLGSVFIRACWRPCAYCRNMTARTCWSCRRALCRCWGWPWVIRPSRSLPGS